MKKNILFLVALFVLSLVAVPATAQSRKDKKAAQKAEWEMEQQRKKEEAELLHQMRMDSIRNVQKRAAEKAERDAINDAAQETDFNELCMEYESTVDLIRARAVGDDLDQQMAVEIARSAALDELTSQISTAVNSLVTRYRKSSKVNDSRESFNRTEGMTRNVVNQTTGYRIACRKTTTFIEKGRRIFKHYIVLEVSKDELLKAVYQGLQEDEELKIEASYQEFKKEFDEVFSNQE
ncbi:MAG: hypothetical protein IKV26_05305 [Paludibacteraceae bacterium]|nr:hypothetical protein [Paludibacteraceae bacterium]